MKAPALSAKPKPRRWRLVLAYEGTDFCGWQRQPARANGKAQPPSVQQTLEEAVAQVTGERVAAVAAGRTDAGVHARGQAVSFVLRRPFETKRLRRALNAVLPGSVRVMALSRVPMSFHPRRDARRKRYVYRFFDGPVLPPLERRFRLHSPPIPDCDSMKTVARGWLGRHDFAAFCTGGSEPESTVRTLHRAEIRRRGGRVDMIFEADGFLRHMVRNMAALLMAVGRGRVSPARARAIFESRDRRRAPAAAPAHGLTLEKVFYR